MLLRTTTKTAWMAKHFWQDRDYQLRRFFFFFFFFWFFFCYTWSNLIAIGFSSSLFFSLLYLSLSLYRCIYSLALSLFRFWRAPLFFWKWTASYFLFLFSVWIFKRWIELKWRFYDAVSVLHDDSFIHNCQICVGDSGLSGICSVGFELL